MRKKRKSRRNTDRAKAPARPWLGILIGAAVSVPVSLALTALAAFLMARGVLPFESAPIADAVTKAASALAAGVAGSSRAAKLRPLFGAAAGCAYIAAATLVLALFFGAASFGAGTLADLAVCALSGAVGGAFRDLLSPA